MSTFAPHGVKVWGSNTPKKALGRIIMDTSTLNRKRLRGSNTIISPYSHVGRTELAKTVGAAPVRLAEPAERPFNVGALRGKNAIRYPTINAWTAEKARALVPEEEEPTKVAGISARTAEKERPALSADDLAASIKMALETMEESPQTDKLKMMLKAIGQIQLIAKKRPLMEAEQDILRDIENELVSSAEAEPAMKSEPIAKARAEGEAAASLEHKTELKRLRDEFDRLQANEEKTAAEIEKFIGDRKSYADEFKNIKGWARGEHESIREDIYQSHRFIKEQDDALKDIDTERNRIGQELLGMQIDTNMTPEEGREVAREIAARLKDFKAITREQKRLMNQRQAAITAIRNSLASSKKINEAAKESAAIVKKADKELIGNIKKDINEMKQMEARKAEIQEVGQPIYDKGIAAEQKAEEILKEAEQVPEPLAEKKAQRKKKIIKDASQSEDIVGLLKSILKKEAKTGSTRAGQLLKMSEVFGAEEKQGQEAQSYEEVAQMKIQDIAYKKGKGQNAEKNLLINLYKEITGAPPKNKSLTIPKLREAILTASKKLDSSA